MAFTYSLSTNIGKVRLKLADTGGVAPGGTATSGYAFDDDEIAAFLAEGGTVNAATVLGAKALIMDAARRQRSYSLPGLSYDDKGRVAALKEVIRMYGGDLPTLTVSEVSEMPMDTWFPDPTPTVRY
jgi:hypothetical protein